MEHKDGVLYVNGVSQGTYNSLYIKKILSRLDTKTTDKALVLGGGTYAIPKWLRERAVDVTVVEIDKDIALRYSDRIPTIVADYREFLSNNTNLYDYVIFDVFNGNEPVGNNEQIQHAAALATKKFLANWITEYRFHLGYALFPAPKCLMSIKTNNGLYQEVYEVNYQ